MTGCGAVSVTVRARFVRLAVVNDGDRNRAAGVSASPSDKSATGSLFAPVVCTGEEPASLDGSESHDLGSSLWAPGGGAYSPVG